MSKAPNFEAIPQELKNLTRWVVWKLEKKKKKNGDVKYTKVPYSAKTHLYASTSDKKTWTSFEEAKEAFEDGGYHGIGFVFARGDGYVGIDLDDCLDEYDGLNQYGRDAFIQIRSYTEYSPSGKGLHIIAKGELPGMGHCDTKRGLEMYDDGRYFTFTGEVYSDATAIEDRELEVKSLYHYWFDDFGGASGAGSVKPGKYRFDPKAEITELDTLQLSQDVVDLVRDGTGMDQFNGDRSVAIFAVSRTMLNAGATPETIATIFSDSANFLAGAALERRGGNVNSARCWLLDQIVMKQKAAYDAEMALLCDDEFDVIDDDAEPGTKKVKPIVSYSKYFERNAVTYLNANGVKRYRGQYYAYDRWSWVELSNDELVGRITTDLSGQSISMSVMNDTVKHITRRAVVESFEVSPTMIAFRNGVLDLAGWDVGKVDLTLKSHHPKYNITSLLDYEYDPAAACSEWLTFLDSSFEGNAELVRTLQQWFGYCLTYDYRFQKMLVMAGVSRSGKGLILDILEYLIGQGSVAGTTLASLAGKFGLEQIIGKKLAVIGDAHHADKGAVPRSKEAILSITGGDTMPVDMKNVKEVSLKITARLAMACNDIPMFYDNYNALENRYLVIPFKKSFYGNEDPLLPKKLKKELAGIFNWAVQGLLDLGREGTFFEGELSKQAKREVRARQNPIGAFAAKYCEEGDDHRVPIREVYDAYLKFCQLDEIKPESPKIFSQRISESLPGVGRGLTYGGRNSKRSKAYLDMRLRDDMVADLVAEVEGFTEVELD